MYTRCAWSQTSKSHLVGFSLIVTIVLLSFMVLILTGLAAFVRVETQVAINQQQITAAQQNALAALNIALGKLQEHAGPDQRATAAADLLTGAASGAPVNGTRYWTGVWGNANPSSHIQSAPRLLNWLVSGNESMTTSAEIANPASFGQITSPAATPALVPSHVVGGLTAYDAAYPTKAALASNVTVNGQEARVLVGPASSGTASTNGYVVAKLEDMKGSVPGLTGQPTIGRYAWWVGDEGVKARINLVDRSSTPSGSETTVQQETRERSRYQLAQRSATELVTGLSPYNPSTVLQLDQILRRQQLPFLPTTPAITPAVVADRFHDISTVSAGVLSDALRGGLKGDLTAGFAPGTTIASAPTGRIWDIRSYPDISLPTGVNLVTDMLTQNGYDGYGPNWQLLRSYAQLANSVSGTGATATITPQTYLAGDLQHAITPIVVSYHLFYEARLVSLGSNSYRLQLRHVPAVVMWNPYNVRLADSAYRVVYDFNGLAVTFARIVQAPITSTSGGGFAAFQDPTGVSAHVGSPYFHNTVGYLPGGTSITYRPMQLQLQSGVMEPGLAYVYTLPTDQTYDPTANWAPSLKREWGLGAATAAGILVESGPFQLPTPPAGQQYRRVFWYAGGSTTGATTNLSNSGRMPIGSDQTIDITTATATEKSSIAMAGDDRLILRLGSLPTSPIAQVITQNNSYMPANSTRATHDAVLTPSNTTIPLGWAGMRFRMKITNPNGAGFSMTGSPSINSPVPWMALFNPRAIESSRSAYEYQQPSYGGYYGHNPSFLRMDDGSSGSTNGRYGSGNLRDRTTYAIDVQNPSVGVVSFGRDYATSVSLAPYHVPTPVSPLVSVGQLQHANPYRALLNPNGIFPMRQAHNFNPAYPIANALPNPRIPDTAVIGATFGGTKGNGIMNNIANAPVAAVFFDHSYLLNRALFDKCFFSTVPRTGTVAFPLTQGRLTRYNNASDTALRSYNQAAAGLLVDGSFNFNSTSAEAWRAVLAATRNVPVGTTTRPTEAPLPRNPQPHNDTAVMTATANGTSNTEAHSGYRFLTDNQITALANSIVTTVRRRGPFVSVADFVNRSLSSTASPNDRRRGTLERAIADSAAAGHPNQAFLTGTNAAMTLPAVGLGNSPYPLTGAETTDLPVASSLPGWITQGDLLQVLAPVLSSRSDTFVIRAYGEAVNPVLAPADPNYIRGRAWAEAVVQRLPEYVDSTQPAEIQPVSGSTVALNPTNARFGRRFQIISFRWLTPADI